jgi:hypothetical protein
MVTEKEKKERFELFKKSFMKYMDVFGIKDVRVDFMYDDEDDTGSALIKLFDTDGVVFAWLCKGLYDNKDFYEQYDEVAFHEVLEVLCDKNYGYLMEKVYSGDICQKANHGIIRTLENVIYPLIAVDKKYKQ